MSLDTRLYRAARRLARDLAGLRFQAPITHVYDPFDYARAPYRDYLRRHACAPKRVVYLGMNPGPFGMAQTGVPFGEVAHVRDWLGVSGRVGKPAREHPQRPIDGFACVRSEVSGARLWGAFAARHGAAENFFRHAFVANYCPLVFMEASGKNFTPDKLPAREREPLFAACDQHLVSLVEALAPEWVIGVGAFAQARARDALAGCSVQVGQILHPSPASPAANRGWAEQADAQLRTYGLRL